VLISHPLRFFVEPGVGRKGAIATVGLPGRPEHPPSYNGARPGTDFEKQYVGRVFRPGPGSLGRI
jgi:hypothetical protein